MKTINIKFGKSTYHIPNAWELITPGQFIDLLADVDLYGNGLLTVAMLRARFVCRIMEWDPEKIDSSGFANLSWIAEQVTFIFNIAYPNNNEALAALDPQTKKQLQKTPPEKMNSLAIARYLSNLDYKYVLDSCFCAQLVPDLQIGEEHYSAYQINTDFDNLTCSLTALQYIEASQLIGAGTDKLPLLAAILYHPGTYTSETAHQLAGKFKSVPELTLQAIAFNFQSFNNYLFTHTKFNLLTAGSKNKSTGITIGALESLYNLPADGLGDITAVEQMNLIKYLTILRKKLIESVRTLSGLHTDHTEIAEKTGLPLQIINSILK